MGEIDPRLPALPGLRGAGHGAVGDRRQCGEVADEVVGKTGGLHSERALAGLRIQSQGPKVRPGEADPGLRARLSAPALPAPAGSMSTSRPQPPSAAFV